MPASHQTLMGAARSHRPRRCGSGRAASARIRRQSATCRLRHCSRSAFPKHRTQRSPDKQRSIERRRRLAASGPLPPQLAAHFTVGELAVLRIVGDEVRQHGCCSTYIDAIAAKAGVCRSTAKNAIREARALGLITMEERRRRGQPSLTNIIRVINSAWLAWLRLGPKAPGVKKLTSTVSRSSEEERQRGQSVEHRHKRGRGGRCSSYCSVYSCTDAVRSYTV